MTRPAMIQTSNPYINENNTLYTNSTTIFTDVHTQAVIPLEAGTHQIEILYDESMSIAGQVYEYQWSFVDIP